MKETELFELMKEKLYTPVVGDILDAKGYMHQFLPQNICPLRDDMKIAGKAMTVLMIDVFGKQSKPFGRLCECLDQIQPNEIYIATGGTKRCAYWGELLTATAKARGGNGAIVDGWHRDTPQVLEQNWSVFSTGCYAQDSSVRTQVVDFRCQIEIGQVTIHDGDYIFGDIDGVLVIPKEIAKEVVNEALEKASKEKGLRKAVEEGISVTDAFEKFGVLQEQKQMKQDKKDMGCRAFQIDRKDNVATALTEIPVGRFALLGEVVETDMQAVDKVSIGHKVALCDISQNEMIIKYGIPIGKATIAIKKGQWVHLHNMCSNYDERSSHLDTYTGVPTDIDYES